MKRSAPLQRRTPLRRSGPLKRTGTLRNTRRRRTRAEAEACERFNLEVCEDRPCFFATTAPPYGRPRRPGHECAGVLDAHHLIEKQWIRRYFSDLPEDELLEILYAPIIGSPLCRDSAHEAVGRRMDHIYFQRVEHLSANARRYWMRQRRRWVLWDHLRDHVAREPDWTAVSPTPKEKHHAS